MARGIQFICAAMVFALLGTVLFASKPALNIFTALAQNDAKKGNDPLDDLFGNEAPAKQPNGNGVTPNKNGNGTKNGNGNGRPVALQAEPNGGSTMIGTIRKLFGDLNDTDLGGFDRDEGGRLLDNADAILERQKEINARDIIKANRQLRVRDCDRINVLVIILDDVGFGELGAYGQQMIATPYINKFSERCVRFTQFYAGSSQDVSSRGTYLSARHTGRGEQHGDEWITVRKNDFTLPKVMYQGGFDTGFMGKWSMGDLKIAGKPSEQGIAHFFGYLTPQEAENLYPDYLWRNSTKVTIEENKEGNRGGYSPNIITDEAIKFLKEHSAYRLANEKDVEIALPQDRRRHASVQPMPFFLTVAYSMPITANGADVPNDAQYSNTNWPQAKKNYASMVTTVDGLVGKMLSALERYDLQERTIVILTSDNGPRTNDVVDTEFFETTGQLRGQQVELFEGAIRVPLLIYHPGRGQKGGFDSSKIWALWDLPPTISQLAGCIRKPRQIDGKAYPDSLNEWQYELSQADKKKASDMLYWEVRNGELAQAVRAGDWKALRVGAKGKWQLYNLKADLAESKDVASEHPELIKNIDVFATKAQTPPGLARVGEEE